MGVVFVVLGIRLNRGSRGWLVGSTIKTQESRSSALASYPCFLLLAARSQLFTSASLATQGIRITAFPIPTFPAVS